MVLDHLPSLTQHHLARRPTSAGIHALLRALNRGGDAAHTPRTVDFAGYRWLVEAAVDGGAPTYRSARETERNAWVDEDGRLHLRLTRSAAGWQGAELAGIAPHGHGAYRWLLDSRVDGLDANVALTFTITKSLGCNAPERAVAAVEVARYGDAYAETARYVVPGASRRFWQPTGLVQSTHTMVWTPEGVGFQSACGAAPAPLDAADRLVYARWESGNVPGQPGEATVRMGLRLHHGRPPTDRSEVEVVVRSFTFVPLDGASV